MKKWIARVLLVVIVVALFVPWDESVMMPLTGPPDENRVPFGVGMLLVLGVMAAAAGLIVGLAWLLVTAGVIKGRR